LRLSAPQVSTACDSGRVSLLSHTRPLPQAVLTWTLSGVVALNRELLKRVRLAGNPTRVATIAALALLILLPPPASFAQKPDAGAQAKSTAKPAGRIYPEKIRSYTVEQTEVEIIKSPDSKGADQNQSPSPDADALIHFGEPRIVKSTPLGITLEVPVTISAVKQGGHVDFLSFEDMVVNGASVTIEDYEHRFNLPNKQPVMLAEPVRLFISTANALMGALGEWGKPKDLWPVTGRVYVFGRFRKFFFAFKRVVPVELSLSLPNPLKNKQTNPALKQ
jgi:hypothetical protein